MPAFSVEYIFRMIDQFSGPSRALANAARQMSKPIHAAGAAANSAAGGLRAYAAAAGAALKNVNALAKAKVGALLAGGKGGRGGLGGMGMFGLLGSGWWAKGLLETGKEASAAENKFRSLVDSVTDAQMESLRGAISTQMKKTGEGYADLMSAAADAAQIVGSADMATNIMKIASSLAQIDTAGKDTAYFAESLAALLGPDGSVGDLKRIGDQLAKQQKLGAGTAGGTIEAYKNLAAMKELSGADPVALMTTIGLIKNFMPALRDSEIGNMAKYGLRFMTMPKPTDLKSLKMLGLSPKALQNASGQFDVAKTQAELYNIAQQKGGLDKIKKAFSGKNVLAGQFWLSMLGMPPEKFQAYMKELVESAGALEQASSERQQGMERAWNNLSGVYQDFKRGLAKFLEPVVVPAMDGIAATFQGLSSFGKWLTETHPLLARVIGGVTVLGGALTAMAIPLLLVGSALRSMGAGAALRALGWLAKGGGRLAMAVGSGVFTGLSEGIAQVYAARGAIGLLRAAARASIYLALLVTGYEAISFAYDNWDKLKQLAADPLKIDIIFPEAPEWVKWLSHQWGESLKSDWHSGSQQGAQNIIDTVKGWMGYDPAMAGAPHSWVRGGRRNDPDWYGRFKDAPRAGASWLPPSVAQAAAEREITARVSLDPIQVAAPPTVRLEGNLTVTGTVNGSVNGGGAVSGSMPLSATAPRGRATAEPAAPAAP